MKRRILIALVALGVIVAVVGLTLLTPGTARAQVAGECAHDATIASLETCVEHCATLGIIDNQGVTNSLLAELNAAQAAVDLGQTVVAIHQLNAFIYTVQAQSGRHIDPAHAQDIVMHAQMVIQTLESGPAQA